MTRDTWHLIPDTWHLALDTWHLTPDTWYTRTAFLFSLLAVVLAWGISERVFERVPHLEDEIAYVWEARVIAENGSISLPSPPEPQSFLVPFVVDYEGRRFGKYPLGWPVVLAFGVRFGLRDWVNPLLAGLAVWLTYRLGEKLLGPRLALLSVLLLLTSPFFWLNAASLLSHVWGMVLTLVFVLGWVSHEWTRINTKGDEGTRIFTNRHEGKGMGRLPLITAAVALGVLALSRPFSAVAVALPFAFHGLYLFLRGDGRTRRHLLGFALLAASIAGLHFVWQYALTGDFFRNPYTLWWEYDKVGFGPGHGVLPGGHTLHQAWLNTRFSLRAGASDLFGWGRLSWLFLLPGMWKLRRNTGAWLVTGIFLSLLILYLAYWVGSWLFGPRYYFEGLPALVILSAAGIAQVAGGGLYFWKREQPQGSSSPFSKSGLLSRVQWRAVLTAALVMVLISFNLKYYLPPRLAMMQNLYTINRERLTPFLHPRAQALTPALVFVDTERWMPYGALLELESPDLTSPFIFALDIGPHTNARVRAAFPERRVVYYNPEKPYVFQVGEP